MMTFIHFTSHKANPSSILQVIVYSTLGHVGGGNRCGGYTLFGVAMTRWLMSLWSTQDKLEGIVPRAAWHWGRDSSVINDPLEEPGCTLLYVGLPSAWGSMEGDLMFSPFCSKAPFLGDYGRHTCIDRPVALVMEFSLSIGTLLRNVEGTSLPGTLRER